MLPACRVRYPAERFFAFIICVWQRCRTLPAGSGALPFRFFGPGVPQRNRAIPDLFLRSRIRIEREIPETLELVALFGTRACKRGFAFCGNHLERIWINERFEIAA